MRLGMLYHYLPQRSAQRLPKAELLAFGSSSQALNAVAFGQADVFIGDTISTHYLLNRGHLPRLRMANFGKHEAIGFGFALRQQDTLLLELVNAVLDNQTPAMRASIFKRWSAGSDQLLTDRNLQLSSSRATMASAAPGDARGHRRHGCTAFLLRRFGAFSRHHRRPAGAHSPAHRLAFRSTARQWHCRHDRPPQGWPGRCDRCIGHRGAARTTCNSAVPTWKAPMYWSATRTTRPEFAGAAAGHRIAIARYSAMDAMLSRHYPQIGWSRPKARSTRWRCSTAVPSMR
jgi:two-component system sensor histidine kinase EvgS